MPSLPGKHTREDTTPTHKWPHLEAFASEVVNLLTPHLRVQMRLICAGLVMCVCRSRSANFGIGTLGGCPCAECLQRSQHGHPN